MLFYLLLIKSGNIVSGKGFSDQIFRDHSALQGVSDILNIVRMNRCEIWDLHVVDHIDETVFNLKVTNLKENSLNPTFVMICRVLSNSLRVSTLSGSPLFTLSEMIGS